MLENEQHAIWAVSLCIYCKKKQQNKHLYFNKAQHAKMYSAMFF